MFQIEQIREKAETKEGMTTTVYLKMENKTAQKIYVTIHMPIIISNIGSQIEAAYSFTGTFTQGYIYPRASVPLIFVGMLIKFHQAKLLKM